MRILLQVLLLVVLVAAVFAARHILLAAFLALVFANVISKLAGWSGDKVGVDRRWFVAVYLLMAVAFPAAVVWAGVHAITEQAARFTEVMSESVHRVEQWLQQRQWGEALLQSGMDGNFLRRALSSMTLLVGDLFSSLGPVLVLVAGVVFGAFHPTPYRNALIWLVPEAWEDRTRTLLKNSSSVLVWWMVGRVASMAVVGVMTWIGLGLLGTPAPMFLALLAALLSFVPNLGPILSLVPAVLAAFTMGPWHVLWVVLLYIGIQTAESNFITPMIQREAVAVPPILLIVFQLAMGIFAGIWGMIVATPLLVVIILLVQSIYIRDYLGKDIQLASDRT